ncbi:hypothetical protein BSLG_006599 [Batrachochytrium salamandrivorans]|nr:hypothetical protein BASA81_009203 [Batrachochytrium salamandrivorans]KAH9265134.1 hypothetical protein BASA83_011365 [Batrachochytrium salamandrivorans]KAJ1337126.1 hypothetical protein BSLG_006599 [Batrachochytrium salamandrivorans]
MRLSLPCRSATASLVYGLLLTLAGVAVAKPVGGANTLVLLDDLADKSRFSRLFASLSKRGHTLSFFTPTDLTSTVPLLVFDDLAFDHALILASKAQSFGGLVKIGDLIDYVNAGGNIVLAASSQLSAAVRDFAYEFSIDYDEARTAVYDHFNSLDGNPSNIFSSAFTKSSQFVVSETTRNGAPIVFNGVGHRVTGKNLLTVPVLTASSSAYSYETTDKTSLLGGPLLGEAVTLASVFQARNNARVAFVGSVDLFSDEYFEAKVTFMNDTVKSGNEAFVSDLTQWAFQEKSVLKITDVKHHRAGETSQHGIYRIKDKMVYSVDIMQWNGDSWVNFSADDVQFEATMLDPYIRKTMKVTKGKFVTTFTLPDQYGVFSFKVDYKRSGLTYIKSSETVQVRPFRHDQYPRFLVVAYPYYTNIFSMMAGFFLFSAVFLFNKETSVKTKTL